MYFLRVPRMQALLTVASKERIAKRLYFLNERIKGQTAVATAICPREGGALLEELEADYPACVNLLVCDEHQNDAAADETSEQTQDPSHGHDETGTE